MQYKTPLPKPIVETSLFEDEKITIIKIKAKNKPTDSLGNNVVKRYMVEVANPGEKIKPLSLKCINNNYSYITLWRS
jgi:hypothetical protein